MPRDTYFQDDPASKLHNASTGKQDAYWLLRSEITSRIHKNWDHILWACPDILLAQQALDHYLRSNPSTQFQVFRPEDLELTHHTSEKLWLR